MAPAGPRKPPDRSPTPPTRGSTSAPGPGSWRWRARPGCRCARGEQLLAMWSRPMANARLAPRLAMQAGRCAHARKFRRMHKALRRLKGHVGRVRRNIQTRLGGIPAGALRERILDALALTGRLLHQGPKDKNMLHALHEPEVDRISGGKARVRHEFGTKVSVAATLACGFIRGARAMPGTPCGGHTLAEALEQVDVLTGRRPALAVVDRGYRGHGVETTRVPISGTRRGPTPVLAKLLRRRSAIEPGIGHRKTDGRLARVPRQD